MLWGLKISHSKMKVHMQCEFILFLLNNEET